MNNFLISLIKNTDFTKLQKDKIKLKVPKKETVKITTGLNC